MSDGSVTIDTLLDTNGFSKGINSLQKIASTGFKTIIAGAGAVTAAFTGMVTASVKEYAELEQNIGGVEKIFGNTANVVIENSKKAYKTAGMDANNYLQTITGFSASLLQGLKRRYSKSC